jgi:hypothetical protein
MPRILLVPAPPGLCARERSLFSPYNLAPLGPLHQHQGWRCKRLYLITQTEVRRRFMRYLNCKHSSFPLRRLERLPNTHGDSDPWQWPRYRYAHDAIAGEPATVALLFQHSAGQSRFSRATHEI